MEEERTFLLSTWRSERSERSHVGRVANCLRFGNSPGGAFCAAASKKLESKSVVRTLPPV